MKGRLHEKTRYENGILYLGLSDVAKPLNEKVDEAIKRFDNLKE